MASTEILEKDGGSAWQLVASLPSARQAVRGVGLDHGRFVITGECWTILNIIIMVIPILQVAGLAPLLLTRCSCTTLQRTSGPQWVISLKPAGGTP